MNRRARLAIAFLFSAFVATPLLNALADPVVQPAQGTLQAAFAPWDDIETILSDVIDGAHKQVLVQAYLLTSKKIASTLMAAHRRGVEVLVLLDAAQLARSTSQVVPKLATAGISIWLETKYQNAHNKIMIVDANTAHPAVITGSFNFTWTAQHRNAENILVVRDNPSLADQYALNWERHRRDAIPYKK
jgi:phosphatidylserine/phosphatidylglycerophosphate/cardiolipin synthase-like enzyme